MARATPAFGTAAALAAAAAALAAIAAAGCDVEGEVGETDPAGPDPSLIAYYKLNELGGARLGDSSGHGHDGNARGTVVFAPGRYGNAAALDGTGWIDVPHDRAFDLFPDFTLAAWVKPDRLDGNAGIVAKADAGSYTYHLGLAGSSLELGWNDGRADVSIRGGVLAAGLWNHVAATVDADLTTHLYVGGQEVQTQRALSAPPTSDAPLGLGRIRGGGGGAVGGEILRGLLDEVRIYTRSQAATEIPRIGGPGVNLPPQLLGLVSATPFNPVVGQPVTFKASAVDRDGDPLTYHWNFGDGSPELAARSAEVVHAFAQPGTFITWLRVGDGHNPEVRANPVSVAVGGAGPPPVFGLLADWRFEAAPDGLVVDSSGHGHSARIDDGATIEADDTRLSRVLRLDGRTGSAAVAAAETLSLADEITIAAWIRPERAGPYGILRKEGEASLGADELAFGVRDDRLEITVGNDAGSSFLAGHVELQVWQHVAVSIDGSGQVALYVRGRLVGTGRGPAPVSTRAARIELGRLAGAGTLFAGDLEDVRIYAYALSMPEIKVLADPGTPVP